jgi:betaine-aldehyde dehydrogenase
MAIAREEVFGPVLSVLTVKDLDEAVTLANSTLYGLSAAVWSRDFSTCLAAARRIRAGTVWLNTFLEGHAELPFGGYRESGIGRELGRLATTTPRPRPCTCTSARVPTGTYRTRSSSQPPGDAP